MLKRIFSAEKTKGLSSEVHQELEQGLLSILPRIQKVQAHLEGELVGQATIIQKTLATIFADGHLLIEGSPGVGKTTLARTLSQSFGGEFRRIQMTSDLLPSDIIGFMRPSQSGHDLELRKGPIFTNFLLADELNRSTPKTQSALLEAMAEKTVSVDGIHHRLDFPFHVIATQNPIESHGVFPLAESEFDRFNCVLEMKLPNKEAEIAIFRKQLSEHTAVAQNRVSVDVVFEALEKHDTAQGRKQSLLEIQKFSRRIFIEDSVFDYFYALVESSRKESQIQHGLSIRGAQQFLSLIQAWALVQGRSYVVPEDVRELASSAMAHRLTFLDRGVRLDEKRQWVEELVEKTPAPR